LKYENNIYLYLYLLFKNYIGLQTTEAQELLFQQKALQAQAQGLKTTNAQFQYNLKLQAQQSVSLIYIYIYIFKGVCFIINYLIYDYY